MTYEVVVAGAGPVGLMLACELRAHGVSTLVLERLTEPSDTIKAGSINVPSAEAFYRRGMLPALDEVQRKAFEAMAAFRRGRVPDADADAAPVPRAMPKSFGGHFGGLWKLDPSRLDPADPDLVDSPATGVVLVPQKEIERVLMERATELGAEIRRGRAVTDVVQHADHVEVRHADADGESGVESTRASYVVGCDGGRSAVRKAAGFDFPGTDPTITGHQAICTLADPEKLQPGWNRTPYGLIVHGPTPGRVLCVEFDGPPAERDNPVTIEELQTSLRGASGTDVTVTAIQSATRFTDNARQAETYRMGRVLLAGDAAHVHSPFGGQGLNLGIQDAANLGWKLASTVKGETPETLLDTYTAERHPPGARVLDATRAQVALLRPDDLTTALRGVVADLMDTDDGNRYFTKLISGLWLHYDLGGGHPMVGGRTPDPELTTADGTVRLAELCHDARPVLLDLTDDPGVRAAAAPWAGRVRVVTAKTAALPDVAAFLVRPDGFVAWAAEKPDTAALESLRTSLTTWFGPADGAR
jgi:2-polyprenyl-6-methoxyphenol hydroxylase-like FAD-dependent oxidoreductase